MSAFLYPRDLVKVCKEAWAEAQKRFEPTTSQPSDQSFPDKPDRNTPPFPPDQYLLDLLETVYHLSFLAEEGRRIAVRVIYVLPTTFEGGTRFNLSKQPARLQRPVPMSVGELLRLAPAVQATESAILVAPAEVLGVTSADQLMIWGILHLGTEWWKILTGAGSAALCPPNCLTISSFSPGALNISTLGSAIARLRNGQLLGTPLPELDEGPIGAFFDSAARELYRDTTKALRLTRYADEPASDRHPIHLYYRTLARLLHLIRDQKHGGTLLVVPDEFEAQDAGLPERLSIKYRLDAPAVWGTLVDEGIASRNYYDLLFPTRGGYLLEDKDAPASKLREVTTWEAKMKRAGEEIGNFCNFVAALSAVDGAVVMTRQMRIIGFGVEIIAAAPDLVAVKQALDPSATVATSVPLGRYGTRHRSAMRMCSSFEDCVALVVSQDGPVKAIKRVGADVVMWNDVTLGRLAI